MSRMSHGATPRELEILGADERGVSPKQIAVDLGISLGTVEGVIARLAVRHCAPKPRQESAVRNATDKLLAAIRRHHPEHCA